MSVISSVNACAVTGAGKIRLCNQDSYCINGNIRKNFGPEKETYSETHAGDEYIYAVFDGMGGEKSGDIASFLCARALQEALLCGNADIAEYIDRANGLVCNLSDEICARCGSTLAIVYISGGYAEIYNIGDSRIYHFSGGSLKLLSVDHTAAQSLVNIGVLSKEEARTDSRRHTLIRHIGISPEEMLPEPHTEKVKINKGDIFLLCTDGVTEALEDHELWEIICTGKTVTDAANEIYEAALEKSGRDNITVIIAQIN